MGTACVGTSVMNAQIHRGGDCIATVPAVAATPPRRSQRFSVWPMGIIAGQAVKRRNLHHQRVSHGIFAKIAALQLPLKLNIIPAKFISTLLALKTPTGLNQRHMCTMTSVYIGLKLTTHCPGRKRFMKVVCLKLNRVHTTCHTLPPRVVD